jgi:hypothetical protein
MNSLKDIDLLLLIQEVKDLHDSLTRKGMIVDSQIEALRSIQAEMLKVLTEMRQELDQFRKDRQICGRLNLLVDAQVSPEKPKTKPKRQQKINRNRDYGKVRINYKSTGH